MQSRATSPKAALETWSREVFNNAAKHKEVTTRSFNEQNLMLLYDLHSNLTPPNWTRHSEVGQAAILVVSSASNYAYECLAIGYCIKADSHMLKQQIKHDTEAITKEAVKQYTRDGVLLSKLLSKLQLKLLALEQSAQARWEYLERIKAAKRHEDQQTKFTSTLQQAMLYRGSTGAGTSSGTPTSASTITSRELVTGAVATTPTQHGTPSFYSSALPGKSSSLSALLDDNTLYPFGSS